MPPKRKTDDDNASDEDHLDDRDSDDEVWDPDYQEEHEEEDKRAKAKEPREPAEDDDEDKGSDDEEYEEMLDADTVLDEEEMVVEEVVPPRPDIVKHRKVVAPDDRMTSDRMSIFECGRVIGDRARHLDNRARSNTDTKNCTSSLEIAYKELMERRIPMAVVRKVGNGYVEIWRVKELKIPKLPPIEYFMTRTH